MTVILFFHYNLLQWTDAKRLSWTQWKGLYYGNWGTASKSYQSVHLRFPVVLIFKHGSRCCIYCWSHVASSDHNNNKQWACFHLHILIQTEISPGSSMFSQWSTSFLCFRYLFASELAKHDQNNSSCSSLWHAGVIQLSLTSSGWKRQLEPSPRVYMYT